MLSRGNAYSIMHRLVLFFHVSTLLKNTNCFVTQFDVWFLNFPGHFRQFDYGVYENLNKYKQFSPPDYELEKVTAPGYLIYSTNDWISSPLDVDRLYSKLKNVLGKILVPKESFSHPDFVYGISAADLVYNNVMRIFGGQKIES